MRIKTALMISFWSLCAALFLMMPEGAAASPETADAKPRRIIASDSILSGMAAALLPSGRYAVEAILPPGQCPGHYDVKLSDIEKTKKADLIIAFQGLSFMGKNGFGGKTHLIVEAKGRNWMAPDSYIYGLGVLADELSRRFPHDKNEIMKKKQAEIDRVKAKGAWLIKRIKGTGCFGKPVIATAMQKEPLEWMGFRVIGQYGRPEAVSARDIIHLAKIGKNGKAVAVIDNLQSGPDTGKGIAEILGVPHVVLSNFPSEKGYLVTLQENVDAIAAAVIRR